MAENSAIEWTDHTFNPWTGCTRVAAGCEHCYAETRSKRFTHSGQWGPSGTRVKTSAENWRDPVRWNRKAELEGVRRRVFCASLADVFEDWPGPIVGAKGEQYFTDGRGRFTPLNPPDSMRPLTMNDLRLDLFRLIDATPWLDWLLLTKRPENIFRMWPENVAAWEQFTGKRPIEENTSRLFRPNVWLLTSIAEQRDADRNVPELLKCRDLVPVLGLSAEPLLGKVRLDFHSPGWLGSHACGIDWVIAGGESGHGARPMHPDWARGLRDQCQAAGVPFFFKQWGEHLPFHEFKAAGLKLSTLDALNHAMTGAPVRVGKKAAGRVLDGRTWDEYPAPAGVTA